MASRPSRQHACLNSRSVVMRAAIASPPAAPCAGEPADVSSMTAMAVHPERIRFVDRLAGLGLPLLFFGLMTAAILR